MAYHHGGLAEALVVAGLELARTGGPEAVVLRAATRAAGVSHNAAYRHFQDRHQLLREVCVRCMAALAERMEHTIGRDAVSGDRQARAWARLSSTGRAYVEFALAEPGWFRTAFAVPPDVHTMHADEGAGPGGLNPYELLGAALDELVEAGAVTHARRQGAEVVAWSAVHGLSTLLVDGPLRDLTAPEREQALQDVLHNVGAGLGAMLPVARAAAATPR